jgi:hypothetical protein
MARHGFVLGCVECRGPFVVFTETVLDHVDGQVRPWAAWADRSLLALRPSAKMTARFGDCRNQAITLIENSYPLVQPAA